MYEARKASHPLRCPPARAAIACALLACVAAAAPAYADDPRAASMVIDANSGAVLHNQAADEPVHPASLTKMMTLYMTFELIEMGRLDYTTKIKMTEEAAAAAPSKLELEPGEEVTLLDAIKGLVTKSANDVAVALAQHIAGSEVNFARLMTRKAREIGMTHTTFRNASGLPDPEQVTTARDMLTLALHLQDDFPRHYTLFATRTFTYAGHIYRNHNTLLTRYRGTDGIKTGYTRASGFNLVSSVRRDGKHLVAAVFGGDTARERNVRMQSLLNAAFAKASTKITRKPAPVLVARAPQPARAKPPRRLADTATEKQGAPPPSPEPASPAPARERETSIAVAKVRRVLIGADAHAAPAAQSEITAAAPRPVFAVAVAAGSSTQPAPPRFAPLAPAAHDGAPTAQTTSGLGLPPSTLSAQAADLKRGAPSPAPALAPAPPPQEVASISPRPESKPHGKAKSARGPFEIQIGAYSDSADAERHMAAARQRTNGMLDPYRAIAIPVQSGTNQLYRARFRGFDATAANETCVQLKRMQIDCFVLKTE